MPGPEWKERKRFFLRSLKDFGFGNKSEETVLEEATQLIQHILHLTQGGQDYLVKGEQSIFNFNLLVPHRYTHLLILNYFLDS